MKLEGAIDLEACLLGGQSFRWVRQGDLYVGVVGGFAVTARALGDGGIDVRTVPGSRRGRWESYFGLGAADDAARAILRRDPALRPLLDRYPGLRILRQDPWETIVAFITSANNNVARITGIMDRIARSVGDPIPGPGPVAVAHHAFPGPDAVSRVGEVRLRAMGLGYRSPFVHRTASRIAAGAPSIRALAGLPDDDLRGALLDLPGVGPKVADCIALFGFGRGRAFPVDRWVARAMAAHVPEAAGVPAMGAPRGGEVARRFAEARWGNAAGLAQQYLFHAMRLADGS